MTHDWSHDVKKYVPDADESAIKGIVKHCGIALRSKDASYVACLDKSERDRVRDSFLKKKLALTAADAELDKAVMDVCQTMKADRDKSRVAFYYLLAEKYGKLADFH
jgi:ribosomal protein S20